MFEFRTADATSPSIQGSWPSRPCLAISPGNRHTCTRATGHDGWHARVHWDLGGRIRAMWKPDAALGPLPRVGAAA